MDHPEQFQGGCVSSEARVFSSFTIPMAGRPFPSVAAVQAQDWNGESEGKAVITELLLLLQEQSSPVVLPPCALSSTDRWLKVCLEVSFFCPSFAPVEARLVVVYFSFCFVYVSVRLDVLPVN